MPWEATGKILSRKVLQTDLSLYKMYQNCGPRWCKLERWLREPSMSLHTANLIACPDQVPGNQCPDTGPSLSKPVPSLQVLQLEHSHGHQPSIQGCILFASSPPPGRPHPHSLLLCKLPVQLLSSVSCWGLPDTGADLGNRKLPQSRAGRAGGCVHPGLAGLRAAGVDLGTGVSTHFPPGASTSKATSSWEEELGSE